MVRGGGIAVTAGTFPYQCAEMARIARGRGTLAPKLAQAAEKRFRSSAFIGLPCPRNTAGMSRPANENLVRRVTYRTHARTTPHPGRQARGPAAARRRGRVVRSRPMVRSPRLRPGDRVAVVAPSSPFDRERFDRGMARLAERYELAPSPSLFEKRWYLAGTDDVRTAALVDAFSDPGNRAGGCARRRSAAGG